MSEESGMSFEDRIAYRKWRRVMTTDDARVHGHEADASPPSVPPGLKHMANTPQHEGDHADRFDQAIKQIDLGMSVLHGLGFIVLNRGHYLGILSQAREQRMRRYDDHRWLSRVAAGVIRTTAPVSDLLSRAEQNALAAKIAAGIIDGMKSLAGSDEVRQDTGAKRTPEQQLEQLRRHRANLDVEIANQESVLQQREDV